MLCVAWHLLLERANDETKCWEYVEMKKNVRIVFGLMLLSVVFLTMSAFHGGCGGPEIPVTPYPEQGCYSNDDCSAGYDG